ncbi:GGDEF domain-containing protein [Legionella genomosp. 1]|uniref:TackOD1 domain-containing metal-binding protein n=1 Tax=Legionella genomosp. 1 TaxID=1093625 RepID=UPI001054D67E|nr:GGDEF domain-containing protein [Legionella genomosp. 1]
MTINNPQSIWMISNISDDKFLPFKVEIVGQINELPKQSPYAIVMSKKERQEWVALLRELRSIPTYRYTPIFYHGDIDESLQDLFDGSADDELLTKAHAIHQRLKKIPGNVLLSEEKEVMLSTYLYTRPELKLRGQISYHNPYVYYFPLITLFSSQEEKRDDWEFLEDLVLRDILSQHNLIDEIKICSFCSSGLLNLKNSCPSCHSIRIKLQNFVHCYTCGKIGPVPEFLRRERLICSRCNTKLEELGVDYDKPVEDKMCMDCGHFFAEAEVNMMCLVCQRLFFIDELKTRYLYDYSLTRRAEYLVQGIEKEIYHNFHQFFNVIDYIVFMAIVSWQAKLAERYNTWYFSIMTLRILNEDQLLHEKGIVNTERSMGQFFKKLRQIFRESDLSSRMEGTMFFLLPMTDREGCLALIDRIRQYLSQEMGSEIKELALGLSYLTSSEMISGQMEGELITTELLARLNDSSSHLLSSGK